METTWPSIVQDFESFLRERGLVLQRRFYDEQTFGNKLLQYGNDSLALRVVLDRDDWSVRVTEVVSKPRKWYDTELLRDLLMGRGEDALSLAAQIEFIQTNWAGIAERFSPERREESHTKLAQLGLERAQRLFPGLL